MERYRKEPPESWCFPGANHYIEQLQILDLQTLTVLEAHLGQILLVLILISGVAVDGQRFDALFLQMGVSMPSSFRWA